jgi:hypothetical protein
MAEQGDPLALTIQDYDWADEVLMRELGGVGLIPESGDLRTWSAPQHWGSVVDYNHCCAKLTPQIDWWPQFVRATLGKESSAQPMAANQTNPPTSG